MEEFDWKDKVENKEEKLKLARRMAKRVKNGETIGFGSGSTSYLTAIEIGKRVKEEKLKIKAIPTSKIIENLCKELEIEITSLSQEKPDWCFDGADEIDPHNWLIKGMGAALYQEKKNIKNAKENYILVDPSKFVEKLGQKHPVPIECQKEKIEKVQKQLKKMGASKIEVKKSSRKEEYFITDNGNYLLHAWFSNIEPNLEEELNKIEGVIDNGLFIGYNIIVVK